MDAAWQITTTVPLARPVMVPIDPDAPPSGPVRLELPPMGSLKVRLVQPDGQPFLEAAVVRVRPYSGEPLQDVERFDGGIVSDAVAAAEGVAAFPRVAPGWKYCVRVEPCDEALSRAALTVESPSSPGDEKAVEVACGHRALRVAEGTAGPTRP